MILNSLNDLLRNNAYPGRGIVLGRTRDGSRAAIAYFIMGRSLNSRNRVFVPQADGGIITRAFDESRMTDPSLIIYAPVRVPEKGCWIITNGDQTDTVRNFLAEGRTFEEALRTRTFEPDSPNWTPRISGLLTAGEGKLSYKLAILKSADGNGNSVQRQFWEYPQPVAGEGHFLHTYRCDGSPIPSFEGEPERVGIGNDLDRFTRETWECLNRDNRVSLFTAFIDLADGKTVASRIVNKNV